MKRIKNLTESKDLINTFNKLKYRDFKNKAKLKKVGFFFKKYLFEKVFLKKFFWKSFFEKVFLKKVFWKKPSHICFLSKKANMTFKMLLMFINLYFS